MVKKGRKSKYTPEVVSRVCEAIATQGGHESGWIAGKISEKTFYHWMNAKPGFREKVQCAVDEFRKNCPSDIKCSTLDRLREALEVGHVVKWKRVRRTFEDGQLVRIEETLNEVNHGTPMWAIERVLDSPPKNLGEVIAMVEESGLMVVDPNNVETRLYLITQFTANPVEKALTNETMLVSYCNT